MDNEQKKHIVWHGDVVMKQFVSYDLQTNQLKCPPLGTPVNKGVSENSQSCDGKNRCGTKILFVPLQRRKDKKGSAQPCQSDGHKN